IATKAASIEQVSYGRLYSPDKKLSRTLASQSLFTDASGIPSSIFSLGGMPGVTGSRDVGITAALSFMDFYIPHNSLFSGDFNRRMRLFIEMRDGIVNLGLPSDITELCIKHIGMAFGTDDPKVTEEQVKIFMSEGGSLARMYTTNPDYRKTES